jgi:hypothetical protein
LPVNLSSGNARWRSIETALFLASVLLTVWALALWLTGGFVFDIASIHIASRRPRNPAVLALACGLFSIRRWAAVWRRSRDVRREVLRRVERVFDLLGRLIATLAPFIGAGAALGIVVVAIARGAFVAGGSDSYGYVSQAHLWRNWDFFLRQPLAREMNWPFTGRMLAPLGYLPAPTRPDASVPTYAPGLPMVMAVFGLLGGEQAMFYVVPILAGLAVAATYLIGSRLAGRTVGAWAALLLATSPAFLFQAMFPMSDLPAAAWWALSLAAMSFDGIAAAAISGQAAGMAILTRPNLVPLAIVPAWWFARQLWTAAPSRRQEVGRLLVFGSGVTIGCAAVGAVNAMWYGAATQSGYGSLRDYYDLGYFWPNVKQYAAWLTETLTPLVATALLGPAAIFAARPFGGGSWQQARAYGLSLVCFVAAVVLSYLFYTPYDAWWYLRFLLPAFPALLVIVALTVGWLVRILPVSVRVPLATAIVVLVAWHNATFASNQGVWLFHDGERKYVVVGEYISRHLPQEAVVLAVQHSGSVRYYSGRQTVRFDWIPPPAFGAVVANLVANGHKPYLVLEKFEETTYRDLFGPQTVLGQLRWSPLARTADSSSVAIYDLVDRRTDLEPDIIR